MLLTLIPKKKRKLLDIDNEYRWKISIFSKSISSKGIDICKSMRSCDLMIRIYQKKKEKI
ncbi:hypothetical protein BpHYR1_041349 [Brachionus plicatilis]|uniref:Uncharacterized protein n=1 Tax=Brachionus plicatilis TaxID=10195 RepID=A0A3M7PNG6_BRAPC|nr:hypothetical protein BpHYR1_041349 [Brachionus plicatilis]